MIMLYYLLYKLLDHPTLWIVKVDSISNELFKDIKNYSSDREVYYIIEREVDNNIVNIDNELNRKQFFKFVPKSTDYIIGESNIIKHSKNKYRRFKK